MVEKICLDKRFSTTKLITKEKPIFKNNPAYRLKSQVFLPTNINRKGEGGLRTEKYFKTSYENKPLISIVTVVYNGEKHLEQTINSVLYQTYGNIEYIIVDGNSTDGTIDVIKHYDDKIDYWVSEPDSGIYNAMNKGVTLCTGDYVAFLNSDDWYELDAIKNIVRQINSNKNVDYLFGNVNIYSDGKFIRVFTQNIENYKNRMPFPHPTLFVRHSLLLSEGFDEKYQVIADYDFIIKLIKKNLKYLYINKVLTNFRDGGVASVLSYEREHFCVAYVHFGLIIAIRKYFARNSKRFFLFPKRKIKKIVSLIHSLFKKI